MQIKYCLEHFRRSITITLKNSKKKLYNILKIYRSIAFLNIISKILKSIQVNRLSWTTKICDLLSNLHLENRKDISSKIAMHILIKKIYVEWKKKLTSSLLLLDVSNAFDNVSYRRLLHNLRKRRINNAMLQWNKSFITNKKIRLRLLDYNLKWMNISIDIL